ncbi:MAG TPA: hypothetical protein VMV51_11610 [Gemmatimonadaceae bacterium]|nr:hypothetical protein [Gemmatimonadaceae bacterium]
MLALAAGGAPRASAQRVRLEYRPHAGDTLRLVLDQRTELRARRLQHDTAVASSSTTSTLRIYSRVIVESTDSTGADVASVTDSVALGSNDRHQAALSAQIQRALAGYTLRLRMARDGSTRPLDPPTGASPLPVTAPLSPSTLPPGPVRVGDRWHGVLPVPPGGPFGPSADGALAATYRLDSLASGGRVAWISVTGAFVPQADGDTAAGRVTGWVRGTLRLDRRRGWLTDSRFTIAMRSRVPADPAAATGPMEFEMRISQHLHAMDKQ